MTLYFPEPASHLEIRNSQPPDEGKDCFSFSNIPPAGTGKDEEPVAGLRSVGTLEIVLNEQELTSTETAAISDLLKNLTSLRLITLSSAGASEQALATLIQALRENCARKDLDYAVAFTLDTKADAFAALSGRGTSLTDVLKVSRSLKQKDVRVRWLVPVFPSLVYRLEAIFSLAEDEGFDPVLIPASTAKSLNPDERQFLRDFLSYRLLDEKNRSLTPRRFSYYKSLCASLGGQHPFVPKKKEPVLVLHMQSAGNRINWVLAREDRPTFSPHGEDPPVNRWWSKVFRTTAHFAEVGGVLLEGIRGLLQWITARAGSVLRRRPRAQATQGVSPSLLLIGAYGGEHIGDMAILGGVLFRFHREYGSTHAVLMTQRPTHTRHLVAMLEVPIEVTVAEYTIANIRQNLPAADAIVFAGGPLIDLPKQLVKHLYTVSGAYRLGKPFIAEGIGPGAFVRWPSTWTARRIVRMAERITVRTTTDIQSPLLRGLDPGAGQDPAFDYLETRQAKLTRLPAQDRQWIDTLTQDSQERLLVGLNLRPIYDLFTVGTSARKRAEYTRFVQRRFEERLAEGLLQFSRTWGGPLRVIFFPMNSIQFGLSDLQSAYRIARLVQDDIDLRVWEADPSIDGVVALLRKIDIVITMRFHATIFALAQQCRVIGIDYRVGKCGKVSALLKDFRQSENCCRIDEMGVDWLSQRLSAQAVSTGKHLT